jgi:Fe2+ or Zn2+ uptake regulation protein
LFKDLGLIEEGRLEQVYCHYDMKESDEHQHLACRPCGNVIEFESPFISKLLKALKHEHDFNLTKIEVYMEGYCQEWVKEASVIV